MEFYLKTRQEDFQGMYKNQAIYRWKVAAIVDEVVVTVEVKAADDFSAVKNAMPRIREKLHVDVIGSSEPLREENFAKLRNLVSTAS